MKRAEKLGEATINGKQVSFFSPPHDEPDFLWVDIGELTRAFLPRDASRKMVAMTQRFDKGGRVATTARNGAKVATIVSHAIAQAMTGAIDQLCGHAEDGGPCQSEYCRQAAYFTKDNSPMSLEQLVAAHKNVGGPFLRGIA